MKGISTEMVVLILMVLIGIALLYFAWTGGFLPFGAGISESDCYTKMLSACSSAQVKGDWDEVSGVAKKCSSYFVSKKLDNCKDCAGPAKSNCQQCCQQDLPTWTPKS
jgi:hypothetical protein